MGLLISNAMAAAYPISGVAQAGPQDSTFSLVMIAAVFVLIYFMLIRPQNKRAQEHRELVNQLKKGDELVTTGGFVGKVVSINEQFMKISLADGVDVHVQRNAVSLVLPKGTIKSL
jgi:preprotein translocase subunit YajC